MNANEPKHKMRVLDSTSGKTFNMWLVSGCDEELFRLHFS